MSLSRWTSMAALGAALLVAPTASAQSNGEPRDNSVSSTGKGITGLALLGAESVMLVEAAFAVRPAWAYLVGGGIGAIGGGVGGYFLEDSASPKVNMYLMATGIALIIPTTVAVLSRTSYDPQVDYTEDRGPADEPVAEPPQPDEGVPGASAEPPRRTVKRRPLPPPAPVPPLEMTPPGVLALDQGSLLLSMPSVEVRNMYTQRELTDYGISQQTEYRFPVFSGRF